MGSWGKVDFSDFKNLQKKLEKLTEVDLDEFCREISKELAARLLRKVIKRTPVGDYPSGSGKTGGTLRRGWSAAYAEAAEVTQSGNTYMIEMTNPVDYGIYVNYGHRTRSGGWVPGQFFIEISIEELESSGARIVEKRLLELFSEVFS